MPSSRRDRQDFASTRERAQDFGGKKSRLVVKFSEHPFGDRHGGGAVASGPGQDALVDFARFRFVVVLFGDLRPLKQGGQNRVAGAGTGEVPVLICHALSSRHCFISRLVEHIRHCGEVAHQISRHELGVSTQTDVVHIRPVCGLHAVRLAVFRQPRRHLVPREQVLHNFPHGVECPKGLFHLLGVASFHHSCGETFHHDEEERGPCLVRLTSERVVARRLLLAPRGLPILSGHPARESEVVPRIAEQDPELGHVASAYERFDLLEGVLQRRLDLAHVGVGVPTLYLQTVKPKGKLPQIVFCVRHQIDGNGQDLFGSGEVKLCTLPLNQGPKPKIKGVGSAGLHGQFNSDFPIRFIEIQHSVTSLLELSKDQPMWNLHTDLKTKGIIPRLADYCQ